MYMVMTPKIKTGEHEPADKTGPANWGREPRHSIICKFTNDPAVPLLTIGLRVSGSRNGVSGSRGVFFPEWCFQFPEGSVVPRVFSVPGLGCFQFPDSGLLFPEWCVGRPWVFSVPGMVFPVPGQRGRHGGVCGSGAVFLLASSCFSAFLCSLLPSFFFSFSHFFRFCLASCYFCFLSSVPAFPLPFLASCPLLPSHPFPFRFVPFQNSLPVPSLPSSNAFPRPFPSLP